MSTDRPRPIQGYREPEQPKPDNPVDPDKFQEELMKVSESDESKKRQQRNLKKRDEGGDTEEEAVAAQQTSTANSESFSAFMGHGSDLDSAFAVKNPQSVQTIQTTASGESFTLDGEDLDSRITPSTPGVAPGESSFQALAAGPVLQGAQNTQTPLPVATPSSSPAPQVSSTPQAPQITEAPSTPSGGPATSGIAAEPSVGFAFSGDFPQQASPTDETKQQVAISGRSAAGSPTKPAVKDQSLYARKGLSVAQKQKQSIPSTSRELKIESAPLKPGVPSQKPPGQTSAQKSAIPTTTKQIITEPGRKPLATKPSAKPEVSQEAKEAFFQQVNASQAPSQVQKPLSDTKKLEPVSPAKERSEEDLIVQSRKEPPQEKSNDGEKDKEKHQDDSLQSAPTTPLIFDILPTVTPPPPSAYSSLPPQLMDLFDKMVGLITVQQSTGIITTTVTLNMPNSVFNGAQIVLDHYATAPNSFNVQLLGSPKAIDLFTNRMSDLVAAMEQNKQSFQINIQKPVLLEEYRTFKRKEKSSGDEGKKDQRQQGG